MSNSPFDFINSINDKKYILTDENKKDYNSFLVNRGLSYFPDTVMWAADCNVMSNLPVDMQYDYLFLSIRKRKRFSKWYKKKDNENVDIIMKYYKYSYAKALSVLPLFTEEQIREMKNIIK